MKTFVFVVAGIAILSTSCRKYETCATYADNKKIKTQIHTLAEDNRATL